MNNNKKLGVAPATPVETSTATSIDNCPDPCNCQVLAQAGQITSLPPPDIKTSRAETVTVRKGHYEPIATCFKHDGFNYRQISRESDAAIYEQRWIRLDGELSENVAFEVIRIQRHEAHTFPNGKSYPAREAYPPSEAWGVDGFTFADKDAAFLKFRQIVAGRTGNTNLDQDGVVLDRNKPELKLKHQLN